MLKCDFSTVALQFYWNHTSAWMFSCNFAAYQNTSEHLFLGTLPEGFSRKLLPWWCFKQRNSCFALFQFFHDQKTIRKKDDFQMTCTFIFFGAYSYSKLVCNWNSIGGNRWIWERQKQPPEMFCKKRCFLETSQNSQENTCARVSFLIKLKVCASRTAFTHLYSTKNRAEKSSLVSRNRPGENFFITHPPA